MKGTSDRITRKTTVLKRLLEFRIALWELKDHLLWIRSPPKRKNTSSLCKILGFHGGDYEE
jgi:hypothetical protein